MSSDLCSIKFRRYKGVTQQAMIKEQKVCNIKVTLSITKKKDNSIAVLIEKP
jgi:hypothetical protein